MGTIATAAAALFSRLGSSSAMSTPILNMPSAPGCPVARLFVVVKSINRMFVMDKKSGKLILSPSDSSETSSSVPAGFSGDSCTLILTRFLGDALRLGVIARFGVLLFFGVAIFRFGEIST